MIEYDRARESRILEDAVKAFPMDWFRQDEWRMMGQGLLDLAVIGAGAWVTLAWPSLWVCLPVWMVMAGRVHALGILTHDLCHVRHLESQPLKRILIDAVVCYPIMMNMDYYGYAHMLHHQWSNVPGKDPYFFPLNRMSRLSFAGFVVFATAFLPVWLILRVLTFPLALVPGPVRRFHVRNYTQFGAAADRDDPVRLKEGEKIWIWGAGPSLFWYAIFLALTATGQWGPFLWAYGVPLLISVLIGQVRLACDHVYEDARDNSIVEGLAGSTNIEAPWWQAVILAPHGAGYHGMHHVAPNVPNWYWRAAHDRFEASGSEVYRSTVYPGYGAILRKLLADQGAWSRRGAGRTAGTDQAGPPPDPPRCASIEAAPEPGFRELPRISFDGSIAPERDVPRITVPTVEQINQGSRDRAYRLEDVAWKTPDRDRLFAPECMSHLYFSEVYRELDPDERRTYNQAFAEGVSEQFMFLEQVLLVRGLKAFLRHAGEGIDPALEEACTFFIEEEDKHSAMFRRMLLETNPAVYEKETFDVYRLTGRERSFLDRSMEHPTFYLWWIWVATLFEEKTIDFHKKYQAEKDHLDPMHLSLHRYHCLDELRHLQMDMHFIDKLWVPAPLWLRLLNVKLFERVMAAFVKPRRTIRAAVKRLVREHPRLAAMEDRLIEAGMGVTSSRDWHEATYSRRTLPTTFAMFDRFPELHGMGKIFPLYAPRPGAGSPAGASVPAI